MSNKLQFGLVIALFALSFIFLLVYLIDCYLHWRHWITEDHSLSVTELGVHDGDVPQRDVLVDKVLVHVALHVVRELGPADAAGVQYSTVQYRLQNWLSVEIRCTEPDITVQVYRTSNQCNTGVQDKILQYIKGVCTESVNTVHSGVQNYYHSTVHVYRAGYYLQGWAAQRKEVSDCWAGPIQMANWVTSCMTACMTAK